MTRKQSILSVLMVFLIASSAIIGGMAGTVSAQQTDSTDDSIAVTCVDSVEGWGVWVPAVGAYQCIDAVFDATSYDSTAELESQAYSTANSIKDREITRAEEYSNWSFGTVSSAIGVAEDDYFQVHYDGGTKSEAKSAGQEALRTHFTKQISNEYAHRNNTLELAYSVSKSTATDANVDTPVVEFHVQYATPGSTFPGGKTVVPTDDSDIQYQTKTLKDGSTMDVVHKIVDVKVVDNGNDNPVDYDVKTALTHIDSDDDGTKDQYNIVYRNFDSSNNSLSLNLNDPYSSDTKTVDLTQSYTRVQEMNSDYDSAIGEVENLVDQLYANHETGTINPADYLSAQNLYEQYSGDNSHYSYTAAKATTAGLSSNLETSQIIQMGGSEYEGIVMNQDNSPQLADFEVGGNGVFEQSSPVLSYNDSDQATLSVGSSDTNTTGDLTYNTDTNILKTTISPQGNTWGEIGYIRIENISGSLSEIPNAEFSVMVDGTDIAKSQSEGHFDLEDTSTSTADAEITLEVNGVTEGDNFEVVFPDISPDVVKTYTATTTSGTSTSTTIDSVSQVADSGVSISDDSSSVTLDKSAVDDYAFVNVSDGNTYVAYGNDTVAQKGIPQGFAVGTEYTSSDADFVAVQDGKEGKLMPVESSFTISSAQDAEGDELDYVIMETEGRDSYDYTANNLQEVLDRIENIEDAIGERGDVDPPSAGGSDDSPGFLTGVLGGAGGVVAILLVLVFMALAGEITSVN